MADSKNVAKKTVQPKNVTSLSKASKIGDMVSFIMKTGEKLQGELLNFIGDKGAMVLMAGGKHQAVKV